MFSVQAIPPVTRTGGSGDGDAEAGSRGSLESSTLACAADAPVADDHGGSVQKRG